MRNDRIFKMTRGLSVVASSSLLLRMLAPRLAESVKALEFIGGNDQFFLNIAMAMGKSILDPARGIAGSTIVTTMCRNGTDFGIRVAGQGERWFTAPVEMPQGLYFPGFSAADANPDIGDSAILEAIGLGAFAMAAAPAVAGFVGAGGFQDALAYSRAMGEIAAARNPKWQIPALDFAGVAAGIDIRRVLETGIVAKLSSGQRYIKWPGWQTLPTRCLLKVCGTRIEQPGDVCMADYEVIEGYASVQPARCLFNLIGRLGRPIRDPWFQAP
jgi:hypothetical protein